MVGGGTTSTPQTRKQPAMPFEIRAPKPATYPRRPFGTAGLSLAALAVALSFSITHTAAIAEEAPLEWSAGTPAAPRLSLAVPETDNVAAEAICGMHLSSGSASFLVGVDFGDQPNGAAVKLRFSGGGQETTYDGAVTRPDTEEGLYGVTVQLPFDDPLWARMKTQPLLNVQVPGFVSVQLPLNGAGPAIEGFINLCKANAQKDANRLRNGDGDGNGDGNGDSSDTDGNALTDGAGTAVQTAFKFARELNSADAYRAFLKNYPTGFFADLARAYLERAEPREGAGDRG
ncbi:MAG: hypothetical protein AAFO73_09190, partial [Pseudomonadota bacterium]